ncbi:MAG: type II toxin-antitoxin system RelE/ParE family toxin [Bdellovibrionota bacterium]
MKKVKEYQIEFLVLENGHCPFQDWIDNLDAKIQRRIDGRIRRIALGNFGDCKNTGKGVLELRLHFGPGYRLYFSKLEDTYVFLLAGGTKKTQKEDIRRAQSMWEKYKR